MIKLKTCKSAAKRIKIKEYKLMRKKAYKSHLMASKSKNRVGRLSQKTQIHSSDLRVFFLMNPYK